MQLLLTSKTLEDKAGKSITTYVTVFIAGLRHFIVHKIFLHHETCIFHYIKHFSKGNVMKANK